MDEYFDLYDADGRPTGERKARDHVHRDGDWHRSVALWIVRQNGRIVLQRRSANKDTRPGLLTASVSGHYASGEGPADVLREAREEIGLSADADVLIALGTWRFDDVPAPGLVDRELQDVYLWPLQASLVAFNPDPQEVAGLVELPAGDFLELMRGRLSRIDGEYLQTGSTHVITVGLGASEFVPAPAYHRAVAQAALAYAAGRSPVPHLVCDDIHVDR